MSTIPKDNNIDNRFKVAYSKKLAEALLANEKKQSANIKNNDDSAESAYKELCFDFPLVPPYENTSALAMHLFENHCSESIEKVAVSPGKITTNDKNQDPYNKAVIADTLKQVRPQSSNCNANTETLKLALSNRFVDGVIETSSTAASSPHTTRADTNNQNATKDVKVSSSSKEKEDDSDYLDSYKSYLKQPIIQTKDQSNNQYTNYQGCNLLALVTFAIGPLHCIHILKELGSSKTKNLNQVERMKLMNSIHSFLGSYVVTNEKENPNTIESSKEHNENAMNDLLSSMNQMNIQSTATDYDATGTTSNDNDLTSEEKKESSNYDLEQDQNDIAQNLNDHDSMEEIWAEESDPDDYDYGDDRYANNNNNTEYSQESPLPSTFSLVDPTALSKKQKHRSLEDTFQCLSSLLNRLSFSNLSHLSTSNASLWNKWNITQILYNLTFTLLQCTKNISQSTSPSNENYDDIDTMMTQYLSMLYMKPLMVLRDRALEERFCCNNSTCTGMDDYVALLQILLRSEASIVGQFASLNQVGPNGDILQQQLSPSRNIGLSSLAALCTTICESGTDSGRVNFALYNKIHTALMNSVDELIDCIEYVRPKKKSIQSSNSANCETKAEDFSPMPSWVRVAMAFLPILDFLSGVNSRSDFTAIETSTRMHHNQQMGIKKSDAQTLLQSGLFREMILLYSATTDSSNETRSSSQNEEKSLNCVQDVIRQKLLRGIVVISSQASSILGKYAVRVPELTQILYSHSFLDRNCVDAVVWYAFMYNIGKGTAPQMRMKGSLALSAADMRDICIKCTIELIHSVVDALNKSQNQINSLNDVGVTNFVTLSAWLNRVHFLGQCWVDTISNSETEIQNLLSKVLQCLRGIKLDQSLGGNANIHNEHCKGKDESKVEKDASKQYRLLVDRIRSSTKSLLMLIENKDLGVGTNSGLQHISSKND